jgi:hypothetical protein
MLGQPAGWIPPVLPKPWDPMIVVGDAERTVHAVPTGTRAKCGYESSTGRQWARGFDLTCPHCWQKIAEEEFERDSIVQCLRKYGHEGPITREDYISFNWAGCKIRPWTASKRIRCQCYSRTGTASTKMPSAGRDEHANRANRHVDLSARRLVRGRRHRDN